jgi:hypothetical protein
VEEDAGDALDRRLGEPCFSPVRGICLLDHVWHGSGGQKGPPNSAPNPLVGGPHTGTIHICRMRAHRRC